MKYYSVSLPEVLSKEQLEEIIKVGYKEIFDKELNKEQIKIYC